MAYRASTILPNKGYSRSKEIALQVKTYLQSRISQFSTSTSADLVLSVYFDVSRARSELAEIATIQGIAQYAKDQEDDQSYDVVSEFSALLSNLDAITSAISANYPRDEAGYLLNRKVVGNSIEFRTYTTGQLASYVALMQTAIDGIS